MALTDWFLTRAERGNPTCRLPVLRRRTLAWVTPLYRIVYDPDGRPPRLRRRDQF